MKWRSLPSIVDSVRSIVGSLCLDSVVFMAPLDPNLKQLYSIKRQLKYTIYEEFQQRAPCQPGSAVSVSAPRQPGVPSNSCIKAEFI